MWHASAAIHSDAGLVPVSRWTRAGRRLADKAISAALEGVGRRSNELREVIEYSVHVRRLATVEEMRVIGPAIDTRS